MFILLRVESVLIFFERERQMQKPCKSCGLDSKRTHAEENVYFEGKSKLLCVTVFAKSLNVKVMKKGERNH